MRLRLALGGIAVVWAACGEPTPPSPGQIWRSALAPNLGIDGALTGCAKLPDPTDQGACAIDAMFVHNSFTAAHCQPLPPSLWRGECFFLVAERSQTASSAERWAMCAHTGQLEGHCARHVYGPAARATAQLPMTTDHVVAQAQRTADELQRSSAPLWGRYGLSYWTEFWEHFHARRGKRGVSLKVCAPLDAPHKERCEGAVETRIRKMVEGLPHHRACEVTFDMLRIDLRDLGDDPAALHIAAEAVADRCG